MTVKTVGKPKEIDEETRLAKNAKIKETMKATRERRRQKVIKTYDLKIQSNKLTLTQYEALTRLFLEAKWIRNDALAQGIFDYELGTTAQVKVGDEFETRNIEHLGSQMKQSVLKQLKTDCYNLSKTKKKGKKVGRLKFVSQVNSIDLKQFGTTYKFVGKNKMKIQNVPKYVRVGGREQIPATAELANAKLVSRADGWHVIVTAYLDPADCVREVEAGSAIGLDFGVRTGITFSDGVEFNAVVDESERLRRLQKKLSRQQKGSNNYRRTRDQIEREYLKISYKKDDIANKLVHDLLSHEHVFLQDDNIASWKKRDSRAHGGRKVHHGVLGRVKARLVLSSSSVVLGRFERTTKTCKCGHVMSDVRLGDETVCCPACGRVEGRDVHAAQEMIILGLPLLGEPFYVNTPVGRRVARVELMSDFVTGDFQSLVSKHWARKHEAPTL